MSTFVNVNLCPLHGIQLQEETKTVDVNGVPGDIIRFVCPNGDFISAWMDKADPPEIYIARLEENVLAWGRGGAGGAGGTTTFLQDQPSKVWDIVHVLGYFPNVSTFDTTGEEIVGEVHHLSSNRLTITFSATVAGVAYLS